MRELKSDKPQTMDIGQSRSVLTDSKNSSPESVKNDMYSRMYTLESFRQPTVGNYQTPSGHSEH